MRNEIQALKCGLIVSAQAAAGEPLAQPDHLLAMALSGLAGGAAGLRLEGVANISHIRKQVLVPIIGLIKSDSVPDAERLDRVYITASLQEGMQVAGAGADIIAIDATGRPRGDGLPLSMTIEALHSTGKAVWADVSTVEEGESAAAAGADVVSTTLWGYTRQTVQPDGVGPDFNLLAALVSKLSVPVVLEGRVWRPEEATHAMKLGAHAVVVGSAITRPQLITKRFAEALHNSPQG